MSRIRRTTLVALICFILTATTASAVSFTDEDGDGKCEPGEKITFHGDDGFDYYDWDFDGDGLPDDNGQVVTHKFDEEGEYKVTVIQTNGHTEQITLDITIESEDNDENQGENENNNESENESEEDSKWKEKIEKILKRLKKRKFKLRILIKLLVRRIKRYLDNEFEDVSIKEIREYIREFIKDYYREHRGRRRRC